MGGFKRPRRPVFEIINLDVVEEKLPAGSYDVQALRSARVVRSSRPVKLLAGAALTKKYALTVHAASQGARDAIAKAGGSVSLVKYS